MTSGKLCMMACPILEDEMVHNLSSDPEDKRIVLLENGNTETLLPKLEHAGIEYESFPESTFFDDAIPFGDGYNVIIWMMDTGLHEEPENLKQEIRRLLLEADPHVDAVMLYYGLCGNGLLGIDDWARENMAHPVTIIRDAQGRICDDCICVPLDGTDNYLRLLRKYAGIMYLTPAFANGWDEFRKHMSLFKGVDPEDDSMFRMIMDMAGYTKAMKVQTGLGDQEHFQENCEKYAEKYGLKLVELEDGWTSTAAADRSYAAAKASLG